MHVFCPLGRQTALTGTSTSSSMAVDAGHANKAKNTDVGLSQNTRPRRNVADLATDSHHNPIVISSSPSSGSHRDLIKLEI